MIDAQGWLDWADRSVLGHPAKVYTQPNSGEWITCHSVVGDLPGHAIPDRFLSGERNPDGSFTDYAAASVMFILYRDGHLRQMYPVTASTWTSGGREANTRSWAIEAEGGGPGGAALAMPLPPLLLTAADLVIPTLFTEPLTPTASATFVRLVREWEEYNGRAVEPNDLRQHKDVAAEFGYSPTACASDRYAGAWALALDIGEEDDMALQEQVNTLVLKTARLERIVAGNGLTTGLTGEDAMAFLDDDDASLALGQGMLQAHWHSGSGGPIYPTAPVGTRVSTFGSSLKPDYGMNLGTVTVSVESLSPALHWLQEILWAVAIAVGVFVLTALLGVEEVDDWRTWAYALAVGSIRVAAGAALDVLRRAVQSRPVQAMLRR